MKRIAVYCGSATGIDPVYATATIALTRLLFENNIGIVYGGGNIGLMGLMADEMIRLGGEIIGVIPRFLKEREVQHDNLTELIVVQTMHERKAQMFSKSDAIISLPGGVGTMEEFFEAFTWNQLGIHHKPCGLLNTKGYYSPLIELLDKMQSEGFLRPNHREMLVVESEPVELLNKLKGSFISFEEGSRY